MADGRGRGPASRVSPRAIRGRIDRGTIASKPNGNAGKLVLVRPGEAGEDGPGNELELLREARVTIAKLEGQVEAARAMAVADVATARAEIEAARRTAEATIAAKDALVEEVKALLAEARRPWWRRWRG